MKIYDKDVYNKQEEIRNVVIIIIAFLVGFFVGYIANTLTRIENVEEQNIINNLDPNTTINEVNNSNTTNTNETNSTNETNTSNTNTTNSL